MARTNLSIWRNRTSKRLRTFEHGRTGRLSIAARKAAQLVIEDRGGEVLRVTHFGTVYFRTWRDR